MKNTNDIMPVCVANVLIVAIFAALAYVFNKWWIIFFAAIFYMSYKSKNDGGGVEG